MTHVSGLIIYIDGSGKGKIQDDGQCFFSCVFLGVRWGQRVQFFFFNIFIGV